MTSFVNSACPHKEDRRILIRCGCPNRRGPEDPMYLVDDAYHRKWCKDCVQYCHQDVDCASPLPLIAADVSPRSNFVLTHAIVCSQCGHKAQKHCTIRCGCPNLRGPDSSMYLADDAFHRHWCSDCLKYCSQDDACTSVLPSVQVPRPHSNQPQISFNLHFTVYSVASGRYFSVLHIVEAHPDPAVLALMKAWIRRRIIKWRGQPVKW